MNAGPIVFDIETGKLPEPQLTEAIRKAWKDPSAGNRTDPEKIKKLHEETFQKMHDRAALDPMTGRILAIGYFSPLRTPPVVKHDYVSEGGQPTDPIRTEKQMLEEFWGIVQSGRPMLGWSIKQFDLPYVFRRSAILDVSIPDGVIQNRRYWASSFIDVQTELWGVGDNATDKLDAVASACGIGSKPADMDGSKFEDMFLHGNWETRKAALEYLTMDLILPWEIARRCGYRPN